MKLIINVWILECNFICNIWKHIKQLKGLIDNSGNVCLIEKKVLLIDYENSVK